MTDDVLLSMRPSSRLCIRSPIPLTLCELATTNYPLLLQLRQPAHSLPWRLGHCEIVIERRPRNPVPLHLVDQRSALQTKSGGCAISSSDYPASCLKRAHNQCS